MNQSKKITTQQYTDSMTVSADDFILTSVGGDADFGFYILVMDLRFIHYNTTCIWLSASVNISGIYLTVCPFVLNH